MNPNKAPLITLLTDFGREDIYVGVMKGVIHGILPEARVVDLSHEIAAFDLTEAAIRLRQAAPFFPIGTVHVVVVDPGVGGDRRALAMKSADQFFVAPDNGVLTLVARHGAEQVVAVENMEYGLPELSATFHGRDLFAPVGAHIACGVPLEKLGPPAGDIVRLTLPEPERRPDGTIEGAVLWADHFGNLVTNIPGEWCEEGGAVEIEGEVIKPIRRTFSEAVEGELLAYVGSFGQLEIAVRLGSAAGRLKAARGCLVRLVKRD